MSEDGVKAVSGGADVGFVTAADTCRGSGDLQRLCPGLQCVAECGGLFVEGCGTHHLVLFL